MIIRLIGLAIMAMAFHHKKMHQRAGQQKQPDDVAAQAWQQSWQDNYGGNYGYADAEHG